jgi:diguanylate cyclase (GGDEF)-like protein
MHGKPLSEAMEAAETLRLLVESHIFFVGEKSVRLTASFGASSLDYNNDPTLINQYSIVDKALYCAKQNGRNRVEAA